MHLATVDYYGVNHRCWLQRCSGTAKIVFLAGFLALVISTRSLPFVGGLAAFLLALALVNKLPLRVLLPLALVPMVLASIFALSLRSWTLGLLVVGRSGAAALAAAVVLMTTAPVRLFGLLTALMPGIMAELLFFTYRSFFILTGSLANTLQGVKLRGPGPGLGQIPTLARVYGMTLVRAGDLASRQYDLLRLRGLGQGLKINRDWRLHSQDLGLLFFLILLAMGWYYA